MSARPIILIVREREKRDGIFDCHHDGRYLCSSPSPFIDGCRHLLAQGYDPTARVVMRHAGSEDDALRGVLGRVAGVEIGSHGVGLQRRRERGTASHVRSPGVAAGTVPREPPSAPTHVRPHGPVSYIPTSEDALTPSGSS
jgi:hypothetical protein